MKELFERYNQQSLEVEKILEKSIETVRSGRSPSESFCDQIGAALRDLRSVYSEIVETLPKKASGAMAPEKASVKQLEAIWQDVVNEKRRSLRAPLEEFVRVYSDDAWYLEEIQEQLEEAKKLLAQMDEDEDASPNVGPYLLFVECVKQDLHQNERLAHKIGKGIEGFPVSAVMGLTMNKYYIREDNPAVSDNSEIGQESKEPEEQSGPEEPEAPEKEPEPVELEMPEESDENKDEKAQIGELKKGLPVSATITIKKDSQEPSPKSSKYINKAKDRVSAMTSCLNYMMIRHLISCKQVNESTNTNLRINKADMDYLVSQGYIGTVCINVNGVEEEYYAPSSKACAYFKKADVANYIKQRIPCRDDYPTADLLKPLSSWDPLFIYRCKLIVDYLETLDENYIIRISRGNLANNYAYCNYFRVKGKTRIVASIRLSEDDYQSELKIIADYVEAQDEDGLLILLVEDYKEIEAFCNLLSEQYPNVKEKILFVLVNDVGHFYDFTGSIVEVLDKQEDADDQEKEMGSVVKESSEMKEESGTQEITQDSSEAVADHQGESKEKSILIVDGVGSSSELSSNEKTNENRQDIAAGVAEEETEDVSEMVSPIKPLLKGLKIPSQKEFVGLFKRLGSGSYLICRNIGYLQVASKEMISRIICSDTSKVELASRINLDYILDTLETKGYLASYRFLYHGAEEVAYCQTELLRSCIQDQKSPFPLASFVAKDLVSVQELVDRFARAEVIREMFEYRPDKIINTMSCLWDEEKGYHTNKILFQNWQEINTIVIPHCNAEDSVVFPPVREYMLIVEMSENLPSLDLIPPAEGRRVFCLNKKWFYELIDGAWVAYEDKKEKEPELGEPELTEAEAIESEVIDEEPIQIENEPQEQPEIPTFEEVVDDTAAVALQNLLNAAYQAFTKGQFYAGMTILHGLVQEDEQYHILADRYGFALGDPYLEQDNRFANLQEVYNAPFGQEAKYDLLACAAYLRMYCSPTAAFDPYSIKDLSFLKDNIACSTFKPLNDLLNSIAHYVGRTQHGLDDRTVASAVMKQTQLGRITEFTLKAKEIQDAKLYRQTRPSRRINKTRLQLFGESGEIQQMLSIVAADKRADLNKVKAFLKDQGISGIVEDSVIDLVMDSAWDDNADAAEKRKTESLTGAERSCMKRQLREIFECLNDWAEEVASGDRTKSSETQETFKLIDECKKYLANALSDIRKKTVIGLSPEDAASYVILEKTVALILDRLEGKITQERYRRNFYIDLLRAPYVALDDERMPIVESKEEQIGELDFCKRAAAYLDVDISKRDWRDVVKKIFDYSADRRCFDFGCVEIIRKYLDEIGESEKFGDNNTEKTIAGLSSPTREKQSPSKWREDFIARFEMAKNDEWFKIDTIRSIEERIQFQEDIYFKSHNYGFYGRALNRMIEYFNEMAQQKKPELQHRLDILKEKYEEIDSWPIVRVIQESIDKLRFGVADSYLGQAEREKFDIVEDNQQPESKHFIEFLDNKYQIYYQQARPESGLTLERPLPRPIRMSLRRIISPQSPSSSTGPRRIILPLRISTRSCGTLARIRCSTRWLINPKKVISSPSLTRSRNTFLLIRSRNSVPRCMRRACRLLWFPAVMIWMIFTVISARSCAS